MIYFAKVMKNGDEFEVGKASADLETVRNNIWLAKNKLTERELEKNEFYIVGYNAESEDEVDFCADPDFYEAH